MKILVKKFPNLDIPKKATSDDAAYDVVATSEPNIVGFKFERPLDGINAWSKIEYIEYKTNLFIAPQNLEKGKQITKFHTLLMPRSSISKKNLILANSVGLIDNGYRGEVCLRFKYVFQPEDYVIIPEGGRSRLYAILNPENIYKIGDRIGQIMAQPNIDIEFIPVEQLESSARNTGGFGSTN
jgi:dUTPase